MMRIKMLSASAGANVSRRKGEIYDVEDAKAKRMIDAGVAEEAPAQKRETADFKPAELRHLGGGWYELPNGEKVQGREEAQRRMAGD